MTLSPEWHYRLRRSDAERCPMCGSANAFPNDWIVINDDFDEAPAGVTCDDCGYDIDGDANVRHAAPFIMPGDAGSHDQLDDHEPPIVP